MWEVARVQPASHVIEYPVSHAAVITERFICYLSERQLRSARATLRARCPPVPEGCPHGLWPREVEGFTLSTAPAAWFSRNASNISWLDPGRAVVVVAGVDSNSWVSLFGFQKAGCREACSGPGGSVL